MEEKIAEALAQDRVVDITTRGRRTGAAHRLEIWMHQIDGSLFITGTPGPRSWYANMLADPAFTLHLKQTAKADVAATARPVVSEEERREVLEKILHNIGRSADIERWVADAPLVEVTPAED